LKRILPIALPTDCTNSYVFGSANCGTVGSGSFVRLL
jgi:hypothetical protein